MPYHLVQLAPGSYDVLRGGRIVASVVRHGSSSKARWSAELLDELSPDQRPAPFTEGEHRFPSFEAICDWLGRPTVKVIRRCREMM
jgi:hypothetical protein